MSVPGLESFFPLFSEVARTHREFGWVGLAQYRRELADATRDPDASAFEKATSWYQIIVADGFDLASYVQDRIRSAPSDATFKNASSQGER